MFFNWRLKRNDYSLLLVLSQSYIWSYVNSPWISHLLIGTWPKYKIKYTMQSKALTITTCCHDMSPHVPSQMDVISKSIVLHASSCRLPNCGESTVTKPLKERLPEELGLRKVVEALTKICMQKFNITCSYTIYWLHIYKRVWQNVVSCLVCMLANREEQIDQIQGTKVTKLNPSELCMARRGVTTFTFTH